MKSLAKVLCCFLALTLCLGVAMAQTVTATLVGKVSDPSGAAVTGAKITVSNVATGIIRTVDSDSSGDYVLAQLPAGDYKLTATQSGFKQTVLSGINLQVDQKARVDVTLTLGTQTESVDVTADAQLLQTESSDIGMVVDSHEMVDIPLNGRKLLDLNLLDAGVARISNFRNDPAGSRSQNLGGAGLSANGTSVDGNNYLVDGLQNEGMQTTHMSYQPTLESVQEFKQQSSQYDASSGFGGGAQINVVTKAGGNSYHGQAYDYLRNDIFDANNYFDTSDRGTFRQNQFGGVFGGPIIKDRTFFFFSYEGTRIRQTQPLIASVPSDAFRSGDLSALLSLPTPIVIYDPDTTVSNGMGGFTRTPFSGNIIPTNRIDPVAAAILDQLIPAPNKPGESGNSDTNPLRTENSDQYSIRVDHHFNNANTVFGRYTRYNNEKILNAFSALPNSFDFVNNPASNTTFGYTAVLSSKMVNEFRFGWSTWNQVLEPTDGRRGTKIDWHDRLGLAKPPGGVPEIILGQPRISISGYGFTGGQAGAPNNRNDKNWQFADNFSFVKGSHQLAVGMASRFWREDHAGINLFARGLYNFSARYTAQPGVAGTGNALADFLLGFPNSTSTTQGFASNPFGRNFLGGYIQDNWNVRPSLTLNLGLRYEYFGAWYDPNENLTFFSFEDQQYVSTEQIQNEGLPRSSYTVPKANIAPRIGLAWRPFSDNKTVVRAGFGMFHMSHTQLYLLMGLNPNPEAGQRTWTADLITPNLTLADAFPTNIPGLGASSGNAVQPEWKTPYNMQWSLFGEREIVPNLSLEVGYVGTRGVKLEQAPNLNAALPGPGTIASRRRYPALGNLNVSVAAGDSWYNALQVNLQRKWRSGFSFKTSYAWSKSLSTTDLGAFAFQGGSTTKYSPFDLSANKGPSEFDVRHRFVVSYMYELPFGHGKPLLSGASGVLNAIVGGWQVNGVTLLQSGSPVDVSMGFDNAGTGGGGGDDRPNMIKDPNDGPRTVLEWFDTSAFVAGTPGGYGNSRRNPIRADRVVNFDFSLFKNFRITESQQLQFRAESFNLFNTPQFDPPNTVFGTANFGKVFSAGDGRQVQLALKYSF